MKFEFRNPVQSKIVVFDGESLQDLEYILKNKKFTIIENRKYRIKTIYCGINFLLNFLLNYVFFFFLEKNIYTIYLYTLIKKINPEIVITSIDNSFKFSDLAKLLDKKIIFIAIQNANRWDYTINNYKFNQKLIKINLNKKYYHIPHFFCFGQHEINEIKKYKINIKKFYKIGSIRMANFFEYIKEKKINLVNDKFDICLISEPANDYNKKLKSNHIEKGYSNVAKLTIRYAKENRLKFIFLQKYVDEFHSKKELEFYKNHLDNDDYKFLVQNRILKNNNFDTYITLLQSKIAIAHQSSLLSDKIGYKQKILSLSIPEFPLFSFPIGGICKLESFDYKKFSQRVDLILKISIDDYLSKLDKTTNYVMEFDNKYSSINKILDTINLICQKNIFNN